MSRVFKSDCRTFSAQRVHHTLLKSPNDRVRVPLYQYYKLPVHNQSRRVPLRNHCVNVVLTRVRLHTGSRLANAVPSQSLTDYYPNSMSTYVTSHWPTGCGSVPARRRMFLCACVMKSLTDLTCFPRNPICVRRF